MSSFTRSAAGLLLALAVLGGCGSSGPAGGTSTSSGGTRVARGNGSRHGGALRLAADPSGRLRYEPRTLRSKSQRVSIAFTNRSPLPHNLTIASGHGTVLGATRTFHGGTEVLTIKLKPGRYTFYCSVPGHRTAGMQGTLIVH
jgi:plastocyanin